MAGGNVCGYVKPFVEDTVGGNVVQEQQEGQPPGKEAEEEHGPENAYDGPEQQPHQEAGRIAKGLVLEFAAKDFRGEPQRETEDGGHQPEGEEQDSLP